MILKKEKKKDAAKKGEWEEREKFKIALPIVWYQVGFFADKGIEKRFHL